MRRAAWVAAGLLAVGLVWAFGDVMWVREPRADVEVDLRADGFVVDGWLAGSKKCQAPPVWPIMTWTSPSRIALGFVVQSGCGAEPVERLMEFDQTGKLLARRDVPIETVVGGSKVALNEAWPGPGGTLLLMRQPVDDAQMEIEVLDDALNDVTRMDMGDGGPQLLYGTMGGRALVFREAEDGGGEVFRVMDGKAPVEVERWEELGERPLERTFSEHGQALLRCDEAAERGDGRLHCAVHVEMKADGSWDVPLEVGTTMRFVGLMDDGTVVGRLMGPGIGEAGRMEMLRRGSAAEMLPWVPGKMFVLPDAPMRGMERYGAFAPLANAVCVTIGHFCSPWGRYSVFDRRTGKTLVDRPFLRDGRVVLSPDGRHYAGVEDGRLKVYSLPE